MGLRNRKRLYRPGHFSLVLRGDFIGMFKVIRALGKVNIHSRFTRAVDSERQEGSDLRETSKATFSPSG